MARDHENMNPLSLSCTRRIVLVWLAFVSRRRFSTQMIHDSCDLMSDVLWQTHGGALP